MATVDDLLPIWPWHHYCLEPENSQRMVMQPVHTRYDGLNPFLANGILKLEYDQKVRDL